MKLNSKKKLISLMLVMILVIGSFAGCSTAKNKTNDSDNKGVETTEVPVDAKPAIDLGGYEFVLASHWVDDYSRVAGKSELDDFILEQFAEIEKEYNCKITFKHYSDPNMIAEEVTQSIMAGDKPFDVLDLPFGQYMSLLAADTLYKINTIPEAEFDSSIYTPIVTNATTINGNTYGLWFGVTDNLPGLFVNYQVIEKAGMENPVELYKKGEWTWDKFREICKGVSADTDGDGVKDQFGVGGDMLESVLLFSNNASYIKDNGNGSYVYNMNSPEAIEAANFARQLRFEDNVIDPEEDWVAAAKNFTDNKTAFMTFFIWAAQNEIGKNMENDYGFIPFPKGPSATEYGSPMLDFRPFVMPKTLTDPEKTGIIFHEIASRIGEARSEAVFENYRDYGLDETGIEVFKTLLSTATPDRAGSVPGLGDMSGVFKKVCMDLNLEPASEFGAIESSMTELATEFYSKIK